MKKVAKGMSKKKGAVPKPVSDPPGKNASSAKSEGGIDLKRGYNVLSRPGALESGKGARKS